MTVKRWQCLTINDDGIMREAGFNGWNEDPTYVLASDYDALAAEMAECKTNCCKAWQPAIDVVLSRIRMLEASYRHQYCESRTDVSCAVCGFPASDPLHNGGTERG